MQKKIYFLEKENYKINRNYFKKIKNQLESKGYNVWFGSTNSNSEL